MGNLEQCKYGIDDEDKSEIKTSKGVYDFKKIVNILFKLLKNIQKIPTCEEEKLYYGKTKEFDKSISARIDRTKSLIRNGIDQYPNGNVIVIIPCQNKNI